MTKRRVLILGRPGVGKTRLAGTFPSPYFIQLEPDGCTTAFPGITEDAIYEIPMSANSIKTAELVVDGLLGQKVVDDAIESKSGYRAKTVIFDSIDAAQLTLAAFDPRLNRKAKWSYDEWGVLLREIRPVTTKLQAIPLHVVIIAHTRTYEGESNNPGVMGLSVDGGLRRELPRWPSIILHIIEKANMRRVVATQPTIYRNYRVLAKDRHRILAPLADREGIVQLPANQDGYPDLDIARTLCGEANERQE